MVSHEQFLPTDQREILYGPERPFHNKTILITGTTRGIGKTTAIEFGRLGARVIGNRVTDSARGEIRDRQVVNAVGEFGSTMKTVLADITTVEGRAALVAKAQELGGIDTLVLNAAGGLEPDKPLDYTETVNYVAQQALVTELLPYINEGGNIVFTTSKWARAYGSVEQLPGYGDIARTKYMCQQAFSERIPELADRNIRLLVVSADLTKDTGAYAWLMRTAKEYVARLRFHMARDFLEPEEVAETISTAVLNRDLSSGSVVEVGSMFMFPPVPEKEREEVNWSREDVERILDMYGSSVIFVDDFQLGEKGIGYATHTPENANDNPSLGEFENVVVSEDRRAVSATIQVGERHVAGHFKPEKNFSVMPGHRLLKIALDASVQLGLAEVGVPVIREVVDIEFLQGVLPDEVLTVESRLIDRTTDGFSVACAIYASGVPIARFGQLRFGMEEVVDPDHMADNERLESAAQVLGLVYAASADSTRVPLLRRVKKIQFLRPIPVGSRVDKTLMITGQNDSKFSGDVIDRIDGKRVTMIEGVGVDLGPNFEIVARAIRMAARLRRSVPRK